MARVLMIIAQKNFRDEELLVPKEIITHAGHEIKIASINRLQATGMLGAKITPDFAVHEIDPAYFDAIIVVGGAGTPMLVENTDVIRIARDSNATGKLTAAICLAPMVLAKAGVLVDKKATVFKTKDAIAMLRANGAIYRDEPLVVDGKIITAEGPMVAGEFGKKIVEMLKK